MPIYPFFAWKKIKLLELHDSVDKETIGEIVRSHEDDLSAACDLLIEKALESWSEDNVTVVIACQH